MGVDSTTRVALAQVNVAKPRCPIDAEPVAEFVGALDRINAVADQAPGFTWRHRSDHGPVSSAD
jgi:hypothetical protein